MCRGKKAVDAVEESKLLFSGANLISALACTCNSRACICVFDGFCTSFAR